jgi:hypothetical protein
MSSSLTKRNETIVSFTMQLDTAKFLVDKWIQHIRSQIERVKRHYDQQQSLTNSSNHLSAAKLKPEAVLESLSSLTFIEDPNFSVDDRYISHSPSIHRLLWADLFTSKVLGHPRHRQEPSKLCEQAFLRLQQTTCLGCQGAVLGVHFLLIQCVKWERVSDISLGLVRKPVNDCVRLGVVTRRMEQLHRQPETSSLTNLSQGK